MVDRFYVPLSLHRFNQINRAVTFDNRESRADRRVKDKFALLRTVWDKWVETQKTLYRPGVNVSIYEQLGRFHGQQQNNGRRRYYGSNDWSVQCVTKISTVDDGCAH